MVGESLMEHVRRLRLERAALRLRHTDEPVTGIAFDAGYETHESFSRAFRGAFGASPSGYRKIRRDSPSAAPSGIRFVSAAAPEDLEFHEPEESEMRIAVRRLDPMRVAFIRHIGPYDEVEETWHRLMPRLGAAGWLGPDTKVIGLSHDDPEVTPPEKLRYDACVTVGPGFEPEGEIGVQEIPGGDYAFVTHHGPYERLGETYGALYGGWLPRSGREPRAEPCIEVYLNHPEETDPEDLLTDIYVPLV
jgi:AraC family transcriptional regulator